VQHWSGTASTGAKWNVYCGDAKIVLEERDKEIFNCLVTSPPDYSLRGYGVANEIGQEETIQEYVTAIAKVMDQVYRVLYATASSC
jgi:DNA modification methylase